jgi:hypothetical protein
MDLIGSEAREWQICAAMLVLSCALVAAVGSDYPAGTSASDRLLPSGSRTST